MSARERILDRLRRPAADAAKVTALPVAAWDNYFLPPFDQASSWSDFANRFTALRGELVETETPAQGAAKLHELIAQTGGPAVFEEQPLLAELADLHDGLRQFYENRVPLNSSSPSYAAVPVGVSTADALLVRSGSILLRITPQSGRRLTILPPFHIIVAPQSQLIPNLGAWLKKLSSDPDWRLAVVTSGPSRTADIEKILVFGAHGPCRLLLLTWP